MKIVDQPISLAELKSIALTGFGDMVKAVVDINRGIMAIDGDLHADEEALLLENGSRQGDLWGINIYPEMDGEARIEFDSMINIRPSQHNRSRGVEDPEVRKRIMQVAQGLIV